MPNTRFLTCLQARIIDSTQTAVRVRSVAEATELHLRLVRDGVSTMEEMLLSVSSRWGEGRCLGTRTVLSEEDEPQPNGRVFKKVRLPH